MLCCHDSRLTARHNRKRYHGLMEVTPAGHPQRPVRASNKTDFNASNSLSIEQPMRQFPFCFLGCNVGSCLSDRSSPRSLLISMWRRPKDRPIEGTRKLCFSSVSSYRLFLDLFGQDSYLSSSIGSSNYWCPSFCAAATITGLQVRILVHTIRAGGRGTSLTRRVQRSIMTAVW